MKHCDPLVKKKLSLIAVSIQILFASFITLCGVTHSFNAVENYYNFETLSDDFIWWRCVSLILAGILF